MRFSGGSVINLHQAFQSNKKIHCGTVRGLDEMTTPSKKRQVFLHGLKPIFASLNKTGGGGFMGLSSSDTFINPRDCEIMPLYSASV